MSFDKILNENRLPALFIGSGLSKRYLKNSPTWEEILLNISEKVGITNHQYFAFKQEHKSLPKMASFLNDKIRGDVINGKFEIGNYLSNKYISLIETGVPFIKLLIAEELSHLELKTDDITNNEISILKKSIDKINNIFTTNFDLFIENHILENYEMEVYTRQQELYLTNSFGISEMYKIHGCINNPLSMIITEEDYLKYNENMNIFISKLYSALLERPIIFLGYGMDDPNINKILESFIKHFPNEKIDIIKKNLIFIEWKEGEQRLIEGEAIFQVGTKQIRMTKITTDRYDKIYTKIGEIKKRISARELKKYQDIIYDLLKLHESDGEKVFLASRYDINKVTSEKMVLGIIAKHDMTPDKGLIGESAIAFIDNALYNNPTIDFDKISSVWVENKLARNHLFPIIYFKRNVSDDFEFGPKFINNEEEMMEKYKKERDFALRISQEKADEFKDKFNNQARNPKRNLEAKHFKNATILFLRNEISEDDFRTFLKDHYEINKNQIEETNFKRAVSFIDIHNIDS